MQFFLVDLVKLVLLVIIDTVASTKQLNVGAGANKSAVVLKIHNRGSAAPTTHQQVSGEKRNQLRNTPLQRHSPYTWSPWANDQCSQCASRIFETKLGSSCKDSSYCSHIADAQCINQQCSCSATAVAFLGLACLPLVNVIGGDCATSSQCAPIGTSVSCYGNKCACDAATSVSGFPCSAYQSSLASQSLTCLPKLRLGDSCCSDQQCQSVTYNSECQTVIGNGKICRCSAGFVRTSATSCEPMTTELGGPCSASAQCGNLGAGIVCDPITQTCVDFVLSSTCCTPPVQMITTIEDNSALVDLALIKRASSGIIDFSADNLIVSAASLQDFFTTSCGLPVTFKSFRFNDSNPPKDTPEEIHFNLHYALNEPSAANGFKLEFRTEFAKHNSFTDALAARQLGPTHYFVPYCKFDVTVESCPGVTTQGTFTYFFRIVQEEEITGARHDNKMRKKPAQQQKKVVDLLTN